MESYAVNLQDKIQKLIDQYTIAKKRIEELESENSVNRQILAQLEDSQKNVQEANVSIARLEAQVNQLQAENTELKKALSGFESATNSAIAQLDSLFPELEEIDL